MNEPLGWLKPLSVLGAADLDYVAARSLLLSGLMPGGQAKGAEAIEKLLKLFALCEEGARTGHLMSPKEVRRLGHDLTGMLRKMVDALSALGVATVLEGAESQWVWDFVESLQTAYEHRYPDQWSNEMSYSNEDLPRLDAVYVWLRNSLVPNMPAEQQEEARVFAGSFAGAYTPEVLQAIRRSGALTPFDLLRLANGKLSELAIEHDRLPE